MRKFVQLNILAVLLATGFGCGATPDMTEEARIWALEQAYFESNREADYKKIASFWHDQFLGWPNSEPRPINKEDGEQYLRRNFKEPGSFTFEIERGGIQVLEDFAINFYTVHSTTKNEEGQEEKKSMRITHTWIKEKDKWKVLGGMSNIE